MNNTHDNIKERLERGKHLSLSDAERTEMKSALLSYAAYHAKRSGSQTARPFYVSLWFRSATVCAGVLIAFVGTGLASLDSLPGDPLYATKVNVIEGAIGTFHQSEQEKLSYSIKRMERRLMEIQMLSEQDLLTPERLAAVDETIADHVDDIEAVLDADTDATISHQDVLRATAEAVAITRTIEDLAEKRIAPDSAEKHARTSSEATMIHVDELTELASATSTAAAEEYIDATLAKISADIAAQDLASTTTGQVAAFLEEATDALSESDYVDASILVSEAAIEIKVEEYRREFRKKTAE